MKKWRNWSGLVSFRPEASHQPESTNQIRELIQQCGSGNKNLRTVGAGHSFTALIPGQVLMSLDRMQGIVEVDPSAQEATVWAGTRLKSLGELLFENNLGQENLGDIDVQSIAGAVSTGTHGTGGQLGTIATQVVGLEMMNGEGETIECSSQQNGELFQAARVSLGVLGVISKLRLRLRPAYKLEYTSRRAGFFESLECLDEYVKQHRHFEMYWFPHSDKVQLKFMDETKGNVTRVGVGKLLNDLLLENGAFWLVSEICRWIPSLCPRISKLCASLVSEGTRVDYSHRIFATRRLVRFQEMEYNIPREHMAEVLRAIHKRTAEKGYRVHFPLECRFVAGDDIWLSPAQGRDSAYVAVHMYKGMPYQEYFEDLQQIFLDFGGRPHWGKWHSLKAPDLAARYPHWDAFLRVRQQLDPSGVFLTPYLKELFGL